MKCRNQHCDNDHLENGTLILDLGNHPWCNNFLTEKEIGLEKKYPLVLMYCNKCTLLQLSYTVPKEVMFKKHDYLSGISPTLIKHFYDLAEENIAQFGLNKKSLIVDIGGNDGIQLKQYVKQGIRNVINIESADNIADISLNKNGIDVINNFFDERLAKTCFRKWSVDLINASGVFFHLEELDSVIKGIKYILKPDGVFVVQFMYAGTMVEKGNYDTIYHEHLCYYTLKSLENLLEPYGLIVFDAYHSDIHSGSIIAKVCNHYSVHRDRKTHSYKETKKIDERYTKKAFLRFSKEVQKNRFELGDKLRELKKSGATIYAYGAPAKGNTILNYEQIDNTAETLIDKCVEVNELKIGKYLPGSHIPIVKESKDDVPDYYLILSHNYTDEIIKRNEKLMHKTGVKFITPFPEFKIIGNVTELR